ncbi:hypothetical protein HII31_12233 [Pseudocercospora fuligena]|uniref:Uncharacterized protein n=1 Tax=Pseudocercospora fuligena TaxID=685502 RepID=A0A8H6R9N9_9PEZI|nr:hypothetical protein HII31_12233 [Pseudocercospora fuligena]
MKDWKGCRGFRPQIAMHVQNSMPPDMIAGEAEGVEPFSAESGNTQGHVNASADHPTVDLTQQHQSTSFEVLVARLSGYVKFSKITNIVPTDSMLQRQARMIIYGSDYPWDQTATDNLRWLELFKMGHGIDEASLRYTVDVTQASSSPDLPIHGAPVCQINSDISPDEDRIMNQGRSQAVIAPNHTSYIKGSHAALGLIEPEFQLPWYWQSPECLAEFRASRKAPSLSVWPELPQYTICQGSDWGGPSPNIDNDANGIRVDHPFIQDRENHAENELTSLMPFDMDINGLFDGTDHCLGYEGCMSTPYN